ncbi:hypothetical protein DEJ51_02615 [Streptomyces venezuelae]|uniref:Uncharacterized protein n=1 Tax=Streptomyces venezuelae TaxID=54571 RepID=A0A5P2DGJ5_STRVZ|nr:hypothetical protein [Streptomyces venezuelae]QES53278.1 hypothetical protein DEJ51_02615 [Streptomyces venezuelae]
MSGPSSPEGDDYSATVLGSHWFSGPPADGEAVTAVQPTDPGEAVTKVQATPPGGSVTVVQPVAPDRVEGSVLRFGPGVTAAMPAPFPVDASGAFAPPRGRRRLAGLRRYALAALVLAGVLAYLGWQRLGPGIEVRDVAVSTDPAGPACDAAADVVAVVATNGRPGILTYRWVRSDGTRSERLTERVPRGQREARLHLLWTFQGKGSYPAKAELQLMSPGQRTAAVDFTYSCAR